MSTVTVIAQMRPEVALIARRQRLGILRHLLAEELADLPTEFDMHMWGRHEGDHAPQEQNYCNTAACALGHAALMPEFQALGLRMQWAKKMNYDGTFTGTWVGNVLYIQDAFERQGESAGGSFFGLSEPESRHLFTNTSATVEDVIATIDRFIARDTMPMVNGGDHDEELECPVNDRDDDDECCPVDDDDDD